MLFLYNEVYLDIFDSEFNEIESSFFVKLKILILNKTNKLIKCTLLKT